MKIKLIFICIIFVGCFALRTKIHIERDGNFKNIQTIPKKTIPQKIPLKVNLVKEYKNSKDGKDTKEFKSSSINHSDRYSELFNNHSMFHLDPDANLKIEIKHSSGNGRTHHTPFIFYL
ncbi:MAG: hypothetical protein KDK36_18450, partial [Leptospiraceae bacterium]|nr:hypothetical protein [Leptospiraceae bacterium]